jgi:hypothetical protein
MPRDRYDDEDDRPQRSRRRDDDDDDRPRRRSRDDDEDDDRPRRSRRRRDDDDDFDRPAETSGNGMAVASLILGILSIFFGPLTGLIGGILGVIALRKPTGKGLAITGMLLSGLFSVAWVVLVVFFYLEGQKVRKDTNNLKQVGLATHNYESAYGVFPRPYQDEQFGRDWKPNQDFSNKLSWRVTILPYLEQEVVYRQFKLNEPWDSGTNRPLADKPIGQYTDAETPTDPTTRLRVFYDNQAFFDSRGQSRMSSITDGLSNTIMYVEGGDKVTWSRFQEYKYDPKAPLPPLGKPNKPTFWVVMGDGSIRSLRKDMSETNLRAMITAQGGEVVDLGR